MQTDCYLQSTTNPLNNSLEETVSIYHISEPIMSENSPKNVLFSSHWPWSSLNSFIQLCEEHCATLGVTHPQDFGAFFIQSRAAL